MKKAFTLAEILITLVIVGIVASLTIPTLINKYDKTQYVALLKKNYNTFNDTMHIVMLKDSANEIERTNMIQKINGSSLASGNNQNDFAEEFKKYFRVKNTYNKSYVVSTKCGGNPAYKYLKSSGCLSLGDFYVIEFMDGSLMFLDTKKTPDILSDSEVDDVQARGGKMIKNFGGKVYIDINGKKRPNTLGLDLFTFYLGQDGLYPAYGTDHAIYIAKGGSNWANNLWSADSKKCGTKGSKSLASDVTGEGCAARIISQGWEMAY